MLTGRPRGHSVDAFCVFLVYGIFALCALLVVLCGADVYRDSVRSMQENFQLRTTLSYVGQKLRQGDVAGEVYGGQIGGTPALVLAQSIDGQGYETLIYCYDGKLCELLKREDAVLPPASGQAIAEVGAFDFTVADGIVCVTIKGQDGTRQTLSVALRSSAALNTATQGGGDSRAVHS